MKKLALVIGFLLLLAPGFALAQTQPQSCSARGYTVVFVNGIFDTQSDAEMDKGKLQFDFNRQNNDVFNNQPVTFQLGYNQTHLAGAGDLLQSFAQQFNSSLSDYDLNTILMQIHPEVTTRKLLLVGHSQGAEYANDMYSYLLAHGEPKQALGVYAVGTPASFVAGGGKYITSSNDKVINAVAGALAVAAEDGVHLSAPLPANISLPLSSEDIASQIGGHFFADDYLADASTQMIGDINGELGALVPTDASPASGPPTGGSLGDCFTPPTSGLAYKTEQVAFAVADPTATVLKVSAVTTYQATAVALNTVKTFATGALQFVADAFTTAAAPPSDAQTTKKTDTVVNKLYGSSLSGLSAEDKKELLGSSQGSAAILATAQLAPKTPPATTGVVLGTSTEAVPNVPAPSIFPQSSNGTVWSGGGGGGGSAASQTAAVADAAPAPVVADDDITPPPSDTTDTVDNSGDSAAPDTTQDNTQDTVASDTPPDDVAPVATTTPAVIPLVSINSSQTDFSGTPLHYWHSDGSDGNYLLLDPNSGKPGFDIGNITSATSTIMGIHIRVEFDTDGQINALTQIPYLYDEAGNQPYACGQPVLFGDAYGNAADAQVLQNPLENGDYSGKMVDMYFRCILGQGNDTIYPNTSYRLYLYPISDAHVDDIYVGANAAGTPFYEISADGTY